MKNFIQLANCASDFHVRGRKMFQKIPESTPNMRGFARFWFRQISGHSLHLQHARCVIFGKFQRDFQTANREPCQVLNPDLHQTYTRSCSKITPSTMIFSAYFTENYPLQLPPKFGVKNSMVQKPTKSFENERLIPKRLPRSDFDA